MAVYQICIFVVVVVIYSTHMLFPVVFPVFAKMQYG